MLFFSDAVFAIAITLFAIDLKVPRSSGLEKAPLHFPDTATLCHFGIDQPGLISFGISFAVIGLFWLGHHGIFRHIVALDRALISINLLFLGLRIGRVPLVFWPPFQWPSRHHRMRRTCGY